MKKLFLSENIFRTKDIEHLFPSQRAMQNKMKALVDDGRICRIKNGLYATINPITGAIFANRYEIGTSLVPNGYIGYHSALEFYGYANQMFSQVQVFCDKRNMPFFYDRLDYSFYLPPIRGGVIEQEQNGLIRITNLERTVIDCIDRLDLCGGIEEIVGVLESIDHLDEGLLLTYLKECDKKCLYQKVGLLLSMTKEKEISDAFFDECKLNVPTRLCDIRENKKMSHSFNKKWNVIYQDCK